MTKQELMETYTAEQLADMVVKPESELNTIKNLENEINNQDNLFLKEIIDSIPPRKHNAYIQWIMIGLMCYGNITLGKYKELSRECAT